jgi:two-component system chemotaxis sensor kinase CheA
MDGNDELVKEFLVESYENLDQLDRDFVALETDPTEQEKIGSIFRTIHTIKGTCGCLGLCKLESVAHVGENLLSRIRDGELVMDSRMTTGLLKLVDAIREMLRNIEATGSEGDGDYSSVTAELVRLNAEPGGAGAAHGVPEPTVVPAVAAAPSASASSDPDEDAHAEVAHHEAAHPTSAEGAPKEKGTESISGNAIRVDVVLLDKLMNLVGELVLARNQVLQYNATLQDSTFLGTAQRLNLITTELQGGVMKTRMQPIGNLWNKFPRVVRDVASSCNKRVRIEMEGRDTELDKTIIEAIKDPLTHVIRNSVDHGIEDPATRERLGKPAEGRLFMRAFHEGGQVNIEISDDGKGIDPEVIKRKALERGLITQEQASRMGEREAIALIFLPGFSTAEKITNVSGRGVGMDVVRTNVEKIGGTVDVTSRVGHGSTLRIKIPLTLAIIPALVVTSGGERFAIPQVSLLELVRVEEGGPGIEMINGTPLYRLRGNLLPLAYLNGELGIVTPPRTAAQQADGETVSNATNIVVLRSGDRSFGLVVDQINDTEEIVVKPLGKQLKGLSVFAGATIMGDGKVALILDVMGVAMRANVVSQANESSLQGDADLERSSAGNRQTLLLFNVDGGHPMGIPLSAVARLEEFQRAKLEEAGGQHVVQYRGQVMPVISVAEAIGDRRARARGLRVRRDNVETDTIQVIVYAHGKQHVGLRVEQILDVVNECVEVQAAFARPGILGTAIIRERVTELLDVAAIVRSALETGGAIENEPAAAGAKEAA